MARQANLDDLYAIITWHTDRFSATVRNQLGFTPLRPSIPMDGKGLRIRVSVPSGEVFKSDQPVEFILGEERLAVSLEAM